MKLITKYFTDLSEQQIVQFKALKNLYLEWNSKINVISRKDIDDLYLKHVLHSLAISKFIDFKEGSELMDVGTGGGFPGIPLAILYPNCQFLLVDSIGKKLKVVKGISDSIGLRNVSVKHSRVEAIEKEFDFVISRAVTTMPTFVSWVKGNIKKKQSNDIRNGIIYLKGGDLAEELKNYKTVVIKEITDYFEEDFYETKKIVYLPVKKK